MPEANCTLRTIIMWAAETDRPGCDPRGPVRIAARQIRRETVLGDAPHLTTESRCSTCDSRPDVDVVLIGRIPDKDGQDDPRLVARDLRDLMHAPAIEEV